MCRAGGTVICKSATEEETKLKQAHLVGLVAAVDEIRVLLWSSGRQRFALLGLSIVLIPASVLISVACRSPWHALLTGGRRPARTPSGRRPARTPSRAAAVVISRAPRIAVAATSGAASPRSRRVSRRVARRGGACDLDKIKRDLVERQSHPASLGRTGGGTARRLIAVAAAAAGTVR